jgi:hypothetical protein
MKKIKIYLTTSLEGLERDKVELGAFIDDLNSRYERYNVYFHLMMDEEDTELTTPYPLQIGGEIADSDLFYIIFYQTTQDKALQDFDSAYQSFLDTKRPRIATYFKQVENGVPSQSVLDFMERLDKELGHYFNNYTHIDTVKLNIILQLKSLGLEEAKVDLKDSALCINDKP